MKIPYLSRRTLLQKWQSRQSISFIDIYCDINELSLDFKSGVINLQPLIALPKIYMTGPQENIFLFVLFVKMLFLEGYTNFFNLD